MKIKKDKNHYYFCLLRYCGNISNLCHSTYTRKFVIRLVLITFLQKKGCVLKCFSLHRYVMRNVDITGSLVYDVTMGVYFIIDIPFLVCVSIHGR